METWDFVPPWLPPEHCIEEHFWKSRWRSHFCTLRSSRSTLVSIAAFTHWPEAAVLIVRSIDSSLLTCTNLLEECLPSPWNAESKGPEQFRIWIPGNLLEEYFSVGQGRQWMCCVPRDVMPCHRTVFLAFSLTDGSSGYLSCVFQMQWLLFRWSWWVKSYIQILCFNLRNKYVKKILFLTFLLQNFICMKLWNPTTAAVIATCLFLLSVLHHALML